MRYCATARNKDGWVFVFFFGGNGAADEAQRELNRVVLEDDLFMKYGPWHVTDVVHREGLYA